MPARRAPVNAEASIDRAHRSSTLRQVLDLEVVHGGLAAGLGEQGDHYRHCGEETVDPLRHGGHAARIADSAGMPVWSSRTSEEAPVPPSAPSTTIPSSP